MSRLESMKKLLRRVLGSILFVILLGIAFGFLFSIFIVPKPMVAIITISGPFLDQFDADEIMNELQYARENGRLKAVVLRIDSPGGSASAIEQIYLDILRLRQEKPVVASIGQIAASGGYHVAIASNFIYSEPTSQVGGIGAFVNLPELEELDENVGVTGPYKATGRSRRTAVGHLEIVRQKFVEAVELHRGDKLKLTEEELSRAEIHLGVESLRYGLIDDIGTRTAAIEKAANLAGLRNYEVTEFEAGIKRLSWNLRISDLEAMKSKTGLIPQYYYLYFGPR